MENSAPKRSRGRPSTTDPEHVLKVAMNAYWHRDPADVSVNELCVLAGVSKPSLYRAFGGEDGLTKAVLERYAHEVLAEVQAMLQPGRGLHSTLAALIDFASDSPRMRTGCMFYKMRSGKHRLGPETQALVEQLDAGARAAYRAFLQSCRDAGEWPAGLEVEAGARYLSEQVVHAVSQRASGEPSEQVRASLTLALSVFSR